MTQRWQIRIATADGQSLLWRREGRVHTLALELGPMWVANFKPALFQVLPDGSIVPRGAAGAKDLASVVLEPAEDP